MGGQGPRVDASVRLHWDQFYGVAAERLPGGVSPLAKRFAPGQSGWLRARALPPLVLELGPGQGWDGEAYRAQGLRVVALDITLEGYRHGVGLGRRETPLVLGDLRSAFPFHDDTFGCCHSHLVLSCDFSDDALRRCLQEIHRVLTPGGRLLLGVRSTSDETYMGLGEPGAGRVACGGVGLRFFSRRQLQAFLGDFDGLKFVEEGGAFFVTGIKPTK